MLCLRLVGCCCPGALNLPEQLRSARRLPPHTHTHHHHHHPPTHPLARTGAAGSPEGVLRLADAEPLAAETTQQRALADGVVSASATCAKSSGRGALGLWWASSTSSLTGQQAARLKGLA